MADNEAAVLEQAQTLQRAKQMQAQLQAKSKDPAQPSVAAIGSPEGPTPPPQKDLLDKAWDYDAKMGKWLEENAPIVKSTSDAVESGINGVGKAIDYVGGYARTGGAAALGTVAPTVHNPVGMDELIDTVKGNAPGVGDYLSKMGMEKEMQTGMTIPGFENHRLTMQGLMNVLGNYKTNPIANGGLQKMGRGMYRAALGPIETAGEKFNKWDVADEYNKQKIWNPLKLNEQVQAGVDANEGKALQMEKQATATPGTQVNAGAATGPAQDFINGLKRLVGLTGEESPEASAAKEMQKEVNHRRSLGGQESKPILRELPVSVDQAPLDPETRMNTEFQPKERPLVYDAPTQKTIQQNQVINRLDANGKPIVNTKPLKKMPFSNVINDATDSVKVSEDLPEQGDYVQKRPAPYEVTEDVTDPKMGLSPVEQGNLNARDYKHAGSYDIFKRGDIYQRFYKALARGGKVANEETIGRALGPEAQAEYTATNEGTGKLLATRNAAKNVQAQAERWRNSATSITPNGTEGLGGAMSATLGGGGPEEMGRRFLENVVIQKAAKALQLGTMPAGYALRNIPTGLTRAAPLLSTWEQIKGDKDGEK